MASSFTQNFIDKCKPKDKAYDIRDKMINELILRVTPSGRKSYLLDCKLANGKRTTKKLGDATVLTPQMARDLAIEKLQLIQRGEPIKQKRAITLKELIDGYYKDWALANTKSGKNTIANINRNFKAFMNTAITDISKVDVERWRTQKLATSKIKAASINRIIHSLKGAITWAVENDFIEQSPLVKVKKLKEIDSEEKIRYLSDEERSRLMSALDTREEEIRKSRRLTRQHSAKKYLPDLDKCVFADYLKPLIIVGLNTGLRRNALFSLKWSEVDLNAGAIILLAKSAKNSKTTTLPINAITLKTLKDWKKQVDNILVFPSPRTGKKFDNCDKEWESLMKMANIKNFRFHDMRHDFASQLVMRGVALNTVRELMTHSKMETTLKYAHLAPENRRAAVDLLCEDTQKQSNVTES